MTSTGLALTNANHTSNSSAWCPGDGLSRFARMLARRVFPIVLYTSSSAKRRSARSAERGNSASGTRVVHRRVQEHVQENFQFPSICGHGRCRRVCDYDNSIIYGQVNCPCLPVIASRAGVPAFGSPTTRVDTSHAWLRALFGPTHRFKRQKEANQRVKPHVGDEVGTVGDAANWFYLTLTCWRRGEKSKHNGA